MNTRDDGGTTGRKLDLLYADVLGDVAGLVGQLQQIHTDQGFLGDQVAALLREQAKLSASVVSEANRVRANRASAPEQQGAAKAFRWTRLVAIVAVSGAVGAGVARLMPMQSGQVAADLALASAVKLQLVQEGNNSPLWRVLGSEAEKAALAAMGQ
jgi:hypothetical protein